MKILAIFFFFFNKESALAARVALNAAKEAGADESAEGGEKDQKSRRRGE